MATHSGSDRQRDKFQAFDRESIRHAWRRSTGHAHRPRSQGGNRSCSNRCAISALCFAAASLHAGPALTQELSGPGIIGKDNRSVVVDENPTWHAIGHVNISGFRSRVTCTGTLVAPNLVLTAAHCVANAAARKPFPPGNIHFLSGVRGGANKGHSTAWCTRFLEGYTYMPASDVDPSRPTKHLSGRDFLRDVVVIVLKDNIAVEPLPLAEGIVPRKGLSLVHAGYGADRRFKLSAHVGCQLLSFDREEGFWFNDCDTQVGSSGGPLLVTIDGVSKVAAVMVGGIRQRFNAAVPISKWIGLTRKRTCP